MVKMELRYGKLGRVLKVKVISIDIETKSKQRSIHLHKNKRMHDRNAET